MLSLGSLTDVQARQEILNDQAIYARNLCRAPDAEEIGCGKVYNLPRSLQFTAHATDKIRKHKCPGLTL